MAKFLIIYNSTQSATETMANASPEQIKAIMDEWIRWQQDAGKTFKMEWGMPLQAVGRVTPSGVTASDIQAGGYAMAEGDSKEALMELLRSHPQLQRPGATIDVLEMLPMPGLEQSHK